MASPSHSTGGYWSEDQSYPKWTNTRVLADGQTDHHLLTNPFMAATSRPSRRSSSNVLLTEPSAKAIANTVRLDSSGKKKATTDDYHVERDEDDNKPLIQTLWCGVTHFSKDY